MFFSVGANQASIFTWSEFYDFLTLKRYFVRNLYIIVVQDLNFIALNMQSRTLVLELYIRTKKAENMAD